MAECKERKGEGAPLLGIIYQYPSKPRIRMRRFRGAISGARGEGANPLPPLTQVRDSG